VDSCHAHFDDEATTEEEKNCKLILKDERLSLVATNTIEPGDQLLTRYGHQHWCKSKWSLLLLLQMYEKYRLFNLTAKEHAQWNKIIALKKLKEQRYLCTLSPKPILRNTTHSATSLRWPARNQLSALHAQTKYKETRSVESTRNTVEP
jgi:hypothetical protein